LAVIHSGTDTVRCDVCGYNYRTLIRTEKSNVQSCFNCFHREFGRERTIEMVRENPQKEFGDYYVRGGFEPVVDDEAVKLNGITIRLAFEYFIWLSNKLHNDQFANDFSFGETHFNDEINFREWGVEYTAYPFAFDKFIAMEVIDRIQHMTFKECTYYLDEIKNTKGSDDHQRSPPLAEAFSQIVVHQNIEHLKDKYGLCPSCRERPLDTKLEGHIHVQFVKVVKFT